MQYSPADLANLMEACNRTKTLVYENPWSTAKAVIATDWRLQIAAVLYPPMPVYHYIDHWLPQLAEKRDTIEKVIKHAQILYADSSAISHIMLRSPHEGLIDLASTAEIVTLGLSMYEKLTLYADCKWDDGRLGVLEKLPGVALLVLRFTGLWLMDLVRASRKDRQFGDSKNFNPTGRVARLATRPYWQALELRLAFLGLGAITPHILPLSSGQSTSKDDEEDFYAEANDIDRAAQRYKLLRSRYSDKTCSPMPAPSVHGYGKLTRRLQAEYPELWSQLQDFETAATKKVLETHIRKEMGERSLVDVLKDFAPVLRNAHDDWSGVAFTK